MTYWHGPIFSGNKDSEAVTDWSILVALNLDLLEGYLKLILNNLGSFLKHISRHIISQCTCYPTNPETGYLTFPPNSHQTSQQTFHLNFHLQIGFSPSLLPNISANTTWTYLIHPFTQHSSQSLSTYFQACHPTSHPIFHQTSHSLNQSPNHLPNQIPSP